LDLDQAMAALWVVVREAPLMRSYSAKSDASGESNANGNGERKSSAYNLGIVFLRRQHRISRKCLHLRYWERIYSPTACLLGGALACGSRVYELGHGAYYGRIGQRQRLNLYFEYKSFKGCGSLGTKVPTPMWIGPVPRSW